MESRKLPLVQKLIKIGDSRAVVISASWLRYYEKQTNQIIKEVAVEVNGKLTIRPIFQEVKQDNPET